MSKESERVEQSEELAVMAPALRDKFQWLMDQVPEADPEEATLSIVTAILGAESPEELDDPWDGEGMRRLTGRLLQVHAIKRLPSDFEEGPEFYLGCDCVLGETGEKQFVTTGSIPIMAQLVTAYMKGWLPLNVVARISERKSRSGYFPMHLEIEGRVNK